MDDVFSPNHYSKMKIEPIDVIEACGLGYRPGSALAYIMRAGHKGDRLADLKKAMNFLHREIYGTWYVEQPDHRHIGSIESAQAVCEAEMSNARYEPFMPERLYVPKK